MFVPMTQTFFMHSPNQGRYWEISRLHSGLHKLILESMLWARWVVRPGRSLLCLLKCPITHLILDVVSLCLQRMPLPCTFQYCCLFVCCHAHHQITPWKPQWSPTFLTTTGSATTTIGLSFRSR